MDAHTLFIDRGHTRIDGLEFHTPVPGIDESAIIPLAVEVRKRMMQDYGFLHTVIGYAPSWLFAKQPCVSPQIRDGKMTMGIKWLIDDGLPEGTAFFVAIDRELAVCGLTVGIEKSH